METLPKYWTVEESLLAEILDKSVAAQSPIVAFSQNPDRMLTEAYQARGKALVEIEAIAKSAMQPWTPRPVDEKALQLRNTLNPELLPIDSAPKDGRYIITFGPSGYTPTALRCSVCCWCSAKKAWIDNSNYRFTDSGADATCWMPLPSYH